MCSNFTPTLKRNRHEDRVMMERVFEGMRMWTMDKLLHRQGMQALSRQVSGWPCVTPQYKASTEPYEGEDTQCKQREATAECAVFHLTDQTQTSDEGAARVACSPRLRVMHVDYHPDSIRLHLRRWWSILLAGRLSCRQTYIILLGSQSWYPSRATLSEHIDKTKAKFFLIARQGWMHRGP